MASCCITAKRTSRRSDTLGLVSFGTTGGSSSRHVHVPFVDPKFAVNEVARRGHQLARTSQLVPSSVVRPRWAL
ncbi:hypothetical protein L210DRAFT_3557826, partial [Boletus edulis BED1]